MNRCHTLACLAFVATSAISITSASAQLPTEEVPKTEPEDIAKVRTAAPCVRRQQRGDYYGSGRRLLPKPCKLDRMGSRASSVGMGHPNAMARTRWNGARPNEQDQTPPNKIGFIFMLAGDTGTSNHDSSQRSTHMYWVQTGPHVMIVGGAAREMLSPYPRDADVKDSTQPCVMFPAGASPTST